ncbi:hypothetical protein WJX72_008668 [[Myrmecia] bisecta]|uniref:ADP-ribosylhydrolase ARH3 n=1 Tax=[Myrmecia] bisecta TaxID=41462 RepID=A0AAW1QS40_9CHLO
MLQPLPWANHPRKQQLGLHHSRDSMPATGATAAAGPPAAEDGGHATRVLGSLLGAVSGDTLGSAVEGWDWRRIRSEFPDALTLFQDARMGLGTYTDDTQMTLALARSLVRKGKCDSADAAYMYAQAFQPERGYGRAAAQVLFALRAGADHRATATASFPEGSFANGGAMRIAPVGLAYRNASPAVLEQAVREALLCTHVHPEGVDGAFIQAAAVAALARSTPAGSGPAGSPAALLTLLTPLANTKSMRDKLLHLADSLPHASSPRQAGNWEGITDSPDWQFDNQVLNAIAAPFQIPATEAVGCALWAVCRHWNDPVGCIVGAVHMGGDTDTIAAMAGAMAGALHGSSWLPAEWWDNLENGADGRDTIVEVARELSKLDVTA